jgi:predicted Zn-dependent peptidase
MHELLFEFGRLRTEPVPDAELEESKRSLVARFALSLESSETLLANALAVKHYGLPEDYWDTYPEKIAAVNAAGLQTAAQKYIDLDHLQIVAVGDAKQIKDVLSKYGPVEVAMPGGGK